MTVDLSTYPPPQHMLRDLAIAFEHGDDGTSRAWLPVTEHVCNERGRVRAGVVATVVDVIGGGMAAIAAQPNWMATADLTLHVVAPLTGPTLAVEGTVVRAGRSTIVLEAEVRDDRADAPLGALATMTFSVLPRRASNPTVVPRPPDDGSAPQSMARDGGGLLRDVYDAFGFVDRGDGVVEVTPQPYVLNSMGALQGGVLASLADAATVSALGERFETVDLHLFYLAFAKEGPVRADATVIERTDRHGTVTVTIDDVGAARHTTRVTAVGVQW